MTETDAVPLLERVRETVARHAMFVPGMAIMVAVSGGADSVALLHILHTLSAEMGWSLTVAHLNHGFRGAESDGEADYVTALAGKLGIPAVVEKVDVPGLRRRRHLSSQEAARLVRHEFLRNVARSTGAERIALGHTADDRVETVLLNLFRGAGPDGMAGFPAMQLPLVRPLYNIRRVETHLYCAEHALNPCVDSSNANLGYHRNRVRLELLPNIRSYYNERVDEAILRMAEISAEENQLLEALAAEALARIVHHEESAGVVLRTEALNASPLPLRRRTLRLAIRRVRGHLQQIPFETIERILSRAATGQQGAEMLPSGSCSVTVTVSAATVQIRQSEPDVTILPWAATVQIPGWTEIGQVPLQVQAAVYDTAAEALAAAQEMLRTMPENDLAIVLREQAITALPLQIRSWREGDRFRPRGLGGEKKLQDLFTDRKIPRELRLRVPVLVDAWDKILAIGRLHADEQTVLLRPERDVTLDTLEWRGPTILLAFVGARPNAEQLPETPRMVAGDRDLNT